MKKQEVIDTLVFRLEKNLIAMQGALDAMPAFAVFPNGDNVRFALATNIDLTKASLHFARKAT